jgi:hypothetical protein
MDELWSVWVREDFWDFGEQGLVFDLAVVAEACGDGIKAGVVIAGVAEMPNVPLVVRMPAAAR